MYEYQGERFRPNPLPHSGQLGHEDESTTEEFYIQRQEKGLVDNSETLEGILKGTEPPA